MRQRYLLVIIFFGYHYAFSANDTIWLNHKWKACSRDTSSYYKLSRQQDNLWQQQIFYTPAHQLYMNGYFTDAGCTIKTGNFKWYNKEGILTDSLIYEKNIPVYTCHFHLNGKKKTIIINDSLNHTTYINSWDQSGNESYSDTFYMDARYRDAHKDTAVFKGFINREGSLWHLQIFGMIKESKLTNAYYHERLCKTPTMFVRYGDDSLVRDSFLFYESGKLHEAWYFFDDGKKNAYHKLDVSGKFMMLKNWDESGNEVKADNKFIYAAPVEGFKAWQRKILKKINNSDSLDHNYRKNLYGSVYIAFYIEKDGSMKEVFIKESSLYPAMDSLILNICKAEKTWKPCILHGRKERFFGVHSFSFVKGKVIRYRTLY